METITFNSLSGQCPCAVFADSNPEEGFQISIPFTFYNVMSCDTPNRNVTFVPVPA